MENLIPKFKTIGSIYIEYLNSFGIVLKNEKDNKMIENMKNETEGEFDLENIKNIPLNLIEDSLRKYLNKESIEKLKHLVKKYIALYKNIVLKVDLNNLSQENTDELTEMFIFFHSMEELYEEFSKDVRLYIKPYKYYKKNDVKNMYKTIFDKVLKIINKENYNDLNIEIEEESKKVNCYRNINKLKNIENKSMGNYILKIETLKEIVDILSENYQNIDEKVKYEIFISLFLARIYDYTKNNIIKSENIINGEEDVVDREDTDLNFIIDIFEQEKKIESSKIYPQLNYKVFEKFEELGKYSEIDSKKGKNDHIKFEEVYQYLIGKTERGFFARYRGSVEHSYANYLIMSGKMEEALKVYLSTLELVKYRRGEGINYFLKEAIYLCAYLRKRRELAKFYKYGVAIGAIEEKLKEDENDEVILNHYEKEFCKYFPIENYYQNIDEKEYNKIKKVYDKYINYTSGFGHAVCKDDLPKLDTKKLNKEIFYAGRKRTPLMILGQAKASSKEEEIKYQDYMRKLIDAGADINIVNTTNQTALIETFIVNNLERALILLEQPDISKSINQCSLVKKVNPFSLLLEKDFLYENCSDKNRYEVLKYVINKLIERGINIDIKCDIEGVTPLYKLIGIRDLNLEDIRKECLNNPESKQKLKRISGINDVLKISSDKKLEEKTLILKHPEIMKEMKEYFKKTEISREKQYELIDIFIKNGADVNKKIESLYNYTPFLFSIEKGDLEIFKKLYNAGGNINDKIKNQNGNILEFALGHNSIDILNYMINELKIEEMISDNFIIKFIENLENKNEIGENEYKLIKNLKDIRGKVNLEKLINKLQNGKDNYKIQKILIDFINKN